ncbi:GRP family sugar transporter [Staphylococcus aureus]
MTYRVRPLNWLVLFRTVASKFGGKPVHQIIGATVVNVNFRYYISRSHIKRLPYWNQFAICLIIRCWLGIGQIITFKAFELVGSSRAMPVTTAFQLLGASLWCLCIRKLPGIGHKIIGFTALVVILIGARMTVWSERK